MRSVIALTLAGCFARQPEPQGPRMVCNGTVVPAGAVYSSSTTCEQIPADSCWEDDSEECEAERDERRRHNEGVQSRERTALIVLGVVGLVLIGAAVYASADGSPH